MILHLADHPPLDCTRPVIVGILNITSDSFASDPAEPGAMLDPARAADAALDMITQGAGVLDIGGESSRPGAGPIAPADQIARVLPVLRRLRSSLDGRATVAISVDTTSSVVARAAIAAGANIINDVSGGSDDPEIFKVAAQTGAGLVLMHRLAPPLLDSFADRYVSPPVYEDVVAVVRGQLLERLLPRAMDAGVAREAIIIDPGLGFGKSVEDNITLIARSAELIEVCGRPMLSALSRKSFVGRVSLRRDSLPSERLAGTLALSIAHLFAGARLFRVHDVGAHCEALSAAWAAISAARPT